MTNTNTWEPRTGEWVAVKSGSNQIRHAKVTRRTRTQARIGNDVYRREEYSGAVVWRKRMYLDSVYLEPAKQSQAELEVEFMRAVRQDERWRLRIECEAAVRTAYERGDDDAIRRAIHELEKGTK